MLTVTVLLGKENLIALATKFLITVLIISSSQNAGQFFSTVVFRVICLLPAVSFSKEKVSNIIS